MRLSILDQSPIISGYDAGRAIEETIALARRADELGYYRYWLAEHHAIAALADPCPEVLVARLGAETRRLRVGTGGVLLPYYSAFRLAESFRMLEALYPGRIDLGIGRAPGGDARTAQAVAGGGFPDASHFPQQLLELIGHLDGAPDAAHPFKRVRLQPEVATAPAADAPIPTDRQAPGHRYSAEERRYVASQRARAVIGSPATCRAELEAMAARYEADEVMVLTITGDYATRRRSYELLMSAFQ